MGTDIHWVAQKRINGQWHNMQMAKYLSYDHEKKQEVVEPGEFNFTRERNYYLFAWLANVRNGHGFAGVKTFEPVKPLTDHRGLPADIKEGSYNEETDEFEGNDFGDHSQGWATAAEILAHPRRQIIQTGVLTRADYVKLRDDGVQPTDWSGGIAGGGIVVVEAAEFSQRHDATHVVATWTMPDGLDGFIAAVKEVADKHGPENVRLVFGFDS